MRKKRTPTYFAFQTPLSEKGLFDRMPEAIREFDSLHPSVYECLRYEVPKGSQSRFRIGIERAGHSNGGYWYCATVEETSHGCRITGNIVFNPDENDIGEAPTSTLWEKIEFVLFFIILLIPIIFIWIGFGIYAIYKWIKHIPRDLNKEEKLVEFMTTYLSCTLTEQH